MKHTIKGIVAALALLLFLSTTSYAASKVPITFDKFHGYTGTVDYLKAVNKAYPNITKLVEIGKSVQGRPIYVLAITNQKTGTTPDLEMTLVYERKLEVKNPPKQEAELGKAAYMINGAIHGNELTGCEVCLYFIDRMVSGYGSDPAITNFIDTKVAYVLPATNPDGMYNTVTLGAIQRGNSMNQEGTPFRQDINKDGKYSQVRYKDPNGGYKVDPANPLRMVRIGRDENIPADQRYSVAYESLPDAGIDLNRNFPEAWWNMTTRMPQGSGAYATSAPEVQALCEFFITHPNVYMENDYHTQGGYCLRPLGSADDKHVQPRDLAIFDKVMGPKYQELMGAEKLSDVWQSAYSPQYNGVFMDWLYVQNGILAFATELWNPSKDVAELKGLSGQELQSALISYASKKGAYLDWKKAKHPTYGDCEVGGWVANVGSNNAFPGEDLLKICQRQWEFDSFCMGLLPQIAIENVKVEKISKAGSTQVLNISADIVNVGGLPTGLQNTENVALLRGDVAWIMGAQDKITVLSNNACEKIGYLGGKTTIPGFSVPSRKTVTWTVAVEGNEPLKIVASALKGGTVVQQVKY